MNDEGLADAAAANLSFAKTSCDSLGTIRVPPAKAASRCPSTKRHPTRSASQPVGGVITVINPILRGWVNYFRVGNDARCFSFVKAWVERKVRRHLMRARGYRGFGWKRWSTAWLYTTIGLFNDYRVSWGRA
jgi:RNA-directed DNA polymerase